MFEYGFKKGKENSKVDDTIKILYFPKQKVIFFEENKNIKDTLNLKIVFPDNQEVIYSVGVIKYWEFTQEDFHKMLLAIQNLIEYLNRNYLHDNKLERRLLFINKTIGGASFACCSVA